MNRFSVASPRGGNPKTNMKMKKYSTPNTETIEAIYGSVLCDSNAGSGQTDSPVPGGGSNSAPKRPVF